MTDSEGVAHSTRSFLDAFPDAEDDLAELVELDAESSGWTFQDTSLDSGRFGDLVSREIAEKGGGGDYHLVDREAVQTVLDGETVSGEDVVTAETDSGGGSETTSESESVSIPSIDIDSRIAGSLVAVLAVVAVARAFIFNSVFRDGLVVSPANDPYFYRYYQQQLLDQSAGVTDLGVVTDIPSSAAGRPLTHTLNWWFAELLGGTTSTAGTVAAWIPIVSAIILCVLVYLLTVMLTDDPRIGLVAGLLLALTPVHATYTRLAFLEHRSYQYVWLAILALALVWLAADVLSRKRHVDAETAARQHAFSRRSWAVATVLAVAVAASVHIWAGSPLTFVPVALYIAFRAAADLREGVPSLPAMAPTLGGIGGGSLLAVGAHVTLGWHEPVAVLTPLLVTVGGVATALLAAGWQRQDLPVWGFVPAGVTTVTVLGALFWILRPDDIARLQRRAGDLFSRNSATEAASLFTTDYAVILGPLYQMGVDFYLALVPLGIGTWLIYRRYEPTWLVIVSFTWVYLFLAVFQLRFAAQLTIFLVGFGAIAVVYVLGKADLARETKPFDSGWELDGPAISVPDDTVAVAYIVCVLLVVISMNLIFIPTLVSDNTYNNGEFEAAQTIDDRAEGLDQTYPDNFVLSGWSESRMYNYFVNGESREYGYALSTYEDFLGMTDPDAFYDEAAGDVGYVIIKDVSAPDESVQQQLFQYGTGTESLAHYQLLMATDSIRAFALVEGATIETTADPGETLTVTTDVSVDGRSFTYERSAVADENGSVSVQVAYPGEYTVGEGTVTVDEQAVADGATVSTAN